MSEYGEAWAYWWLSASGWITGFRVRTPTTRA